MAQRKHRAVVKVAIGAYAPDYEPGSRRRKHEAALAVLRDTAATGKTAMDDIMRAQALKWGVAPEDVDLFVSRPLAYREMMDEREKAAARAAVEDGANTNHDNLEG